ncbi:Deoxyguanosinetriphosphate triphosphohydrolase [Roseomonas mucosa]|uniref:Deoxyguanosinetriphosphate triphosphohydrolase n=1 Tax=Roseomonas mucosa TaxID=207340 RepID=A0A1S8D3J0_9PROT|nr:MULTISPECIES: dNTP triphosphohydrolase [Roseomonas]ATR21172.1 deoxyguanosinetriphosphate triphosphohydrolase [Roseomonas sp. FDAARGOS_362]AWV22240.1 Deoxyguanosinetriphosphate triphosphohydrolase [Roseomonas mucosa]MDT8275834.1 dNTP triphosphohydrolase [Roseomonas mucosa]MDT8354670.1 dNTP triphosphohydrolase [Roseomonas mucosa]MDU7520796.1 dNTP triphosphohydrolase [Roseomonas mucosa]
MHWITLLDTRRLGPGSMSQEELFPGDDEPDGNPFQTDGDRIVFSRPFRRLQQKTQAHPLPFNAHVRNRLVHTLEVAAVGRSLGYAVGVRLGEELRATGRSADDLGYLVHAICLAHDIGNPPFGHAGEEVIAAWMSRWLREVGEGSGLELDPDLAYFDGNAQGFRVLTRADGHRGGGGLRLTVATLGGFLKYPWEAGDPRAARDGVPGVKFNVFATERGIFEEVRNACDLSGPLPRHPAVWLMEAADDIVYTLADLEDALELGILRFTDYAAIVAPLAEVSMARLEREADEGGRVTLLRTLAIRRLLRAVAEVFMAHRQTILGGALRPGESLTRLMGPVAPALFDALGIAARRTEEVVYFNARKVEFEIGAHDVLGKALSVFVPACLAFARANGDAARLNLRERQALSLLLDYHPRPGMSASEVMRCAVDFVAGMTDSYASWLAAKLRGLDTRV